MFVSRIHATSAIAALVVSSAALTAQHIPIHTDSAGARAEFVKGMRALDANRPDDARSHFDAAIKHDRELAAAYWARAQAATSGADWKAHISRAETLKDGASPYVRLEVERALAFVDGDSAATAALGNQLVGIYPAMASAHTSVAGDFNGMKQYELARAAMKTAIALEPDYGPAYRGLINSYLFNEPKNLGHARKYADNLVNLEPDEANSYILAGDVARAAQDLESARDHYAAAIEVNPAESVGHAKKGHAETFLGNYDAARKDYENAAMAAETAGERAGYEQFIALTYVHDGNPQRAMKVYDSIVKDLRNSEAKKEEVTFPLANLHQQRGVLAMETGRFDEADTAVDEMVEALEAGIMQVGKPEWAQTQRSFQKIMRGMVAARRGDLEKARSLAEESHGLVANHSNPRRHENFHQLMGMIELKAGNPAAAVSHLEQANDQNLFVKFELAQALEAAGHGDQAKALYKEVADNRFNGLDNALLRAKAAARG